MNPLKYAEQAITVEPAMPTPWLRDVQGLFALALHSQGYPTPERGGAVLFYGPTGKVNNTLDVPAQQLRTFLAETIERVAEDCISVLSQAHLEEDVYARVSTAIRRHFEIEGS
jgi:hypothetical protein